MLKKLLMLTASLAMVMVLTSCEEETTDPGRYTTLRLMHQQNLMATSTDAQTVTIKWDAPVDW